MATTLAPVAATSNFHLQPPPPSQTLPTDKLAFTQQRPNMPDTPPSSASPERSMDPSNLWRPGPGQLYPGNPNIYVHSELNTSVPFRHIRPMRKPLSVPAALRADKPAVAPMADTPPESQQNSIYEVEDVAGETMTAAEVEEIEETEETNTLPDEDMTENQKKQRQINQLYRGISSQAKRDLDEDLGVVTEEEPTTAHWKPDSSSNACKICSTTFTLFNRRHHCRHCGELVCGDDSTKTVRLDHNAHFHPGGHQVRACDECRKDYLTVNSIRKIQATIINEDGTTAPRPVRVDGERDELEARALRNMSLARSFGAVEWSTF